MSRVAEAVGSSFTPVVSPETLRELSDVPEKSSPAKMGLTHARMQVLLARLARVAEHQEDRPLPFALRDPSDAMFVALAANHGVEYLVSGDKDLLDDAAVRDYLASHGVKLVTVREFVDVLEEARSAD